MKTISRWLNRILLFGFGLVIFFALYLSLWDYQFAGVYSDAQSSELVEARIELGKKLYISMNCAACHGSNGRAPEGELSRLAGQKAMYLKNQIVDISEGRRTSGAVSMMRNAMPKVSAEEAEAIAAYLAQLSPD